MLNDDLFREVIQYTGESISKFRLLSRKYKQLVTTMTRSLRIKYADDIEGDLLCRIIKRNPFLTELNLDGARKLTISHLHKVKSLPIKRVTTLSLNRCKGVNNGVLYLLIQMAGNIKRLNIVNVGANDTFFNDLNRRVHLKKLKELAIGPSFTDVSA